MDPHDVGHDTSLTISTITPDGRVLASTWLYARGADSAGAEHAALVLDYWLRTRLEVASSTPALPAAQHELFGLPANVATPCR